MALYIVATPIGNLKDISQRALETLKKVDFILAEDTRVTKKLLNHFEINKKIFSFHQHSPEKDIKKFANYLNQDKDIALVSDAGTPGIADPAGKLVYFLRKNYPKVNIVPIPGANALITALSVSGFFANRFLFLGFPPSKKKRQKFFKKAIEEDYTVVIYESPYRILKTLLELKQNMQKTGKWREVIVFKELTKKFEESFFGHISEIIKTLEKKPIKGEFIIILGPKIKLDRE